MDSFALPSLLVFEFLSFSLSLVPSGFLVALLHLSAAFLVVLTVSESLRNVSEGILSVSRLSEPLSLLDHSRTRLLSLSTGTGSGSTLRSLSGTLAIIIAFLGILRDCVSPHEENSSSIKALQLFSRIFGQQNWLLSIFSRRVCLSCSSRSGASGY
jgi:hypothetical protein